MRELDYLKLLGKQYKTVGDVTTEIINLQAILNLPKGTEHFLTDIHGEYEAFTHHLRTASGVLKFKVDDIFGFSMSQEDKKNFTTLIFYPEGKIKHIKETQENLRDWYRVNMYRLISICKVVSSKYTRSKVRKALPKDFGYILEELLNLESTQLNKEDYYHQIINTIIDLERADEFIIEISKVIQRLAVDKLHIIGDIYDRGSGAHLIMEELMKHHDADIQWGNHDILWMGAAMGHPILVATAIRIALRYGNLETLEEGYGINMLPLGSLAMRHYADDPSKEFQPKLSKEQFYTEKDTELIAKMHKAIAIIQFKLEGSRIPKRKEFGMDDRMLLHKIDYEKGTIKIDGKDYQLSSNNFPTIDPKDPYKLTTEEEEVVKKLTFYFKNSDKLQKHMHLFYTNGSMYLKYNGNLLYHGCIVLDDKGNYQEYEIEGKKYKGKPLLDKFEQLVRKAYFTKDVYSADWLWYLWAGKCSPMFAKSKMATFERYFLKEKSLQKEGLNPYFKMRDREDICKKILADFGMDPDEGHIINGHTPVEEKKGENPIKGEGRLLVIDGGLSKAYQSKTGIAGYTLIYNSWGLRLVSHTPFTSIEKSVREGVEINSSMRVVEKTNRKTVSDTDIGIGIKEQIEDLKALLAAYRNGSVKETLLINKDSFNCI